MHPWPVGDLYCICAVARCRCRCLGLAYRPVLCMPAGVCLCKHTWLQDVLRVDRRDTPCWGAPLKGEHRFYMHRTHPNDSLSLLTPKHPAVCQNQVYNECYTMHHQANQCTTKPTHRHALAQFLQEHAACVHETEEGPPSLTLSHSNHQSGTTTHLQNRCQPCRPLTAAPGPPPAARRHPARGRHELPCALLQPPLSASPPSAAPPPAPPPPNWPSSWPTHQPPC